MCSAALDWFIPARDGHQTPAVFLLSKIPYLKGGKKTRTHKKDRAPNSPAVVLYIQRPWLIFLSSFFFTLNFGSSEIKGEKKKRIIAIADVRPMMCARIYRVHFVVFFSMPSIIGEAGRLFKESNKGKVDSISDRVRQRRGEKLMEVIHERIRQVKFSRARRAKRLGWGRREVKFPVGSNQCV